MVVEVADMPFTSDDIEDGGVVEGGGGGGNGGSGGISLKENDVWDVEVILVWRLKFKDTYVIKKWVCM